MFSRLSSRVCQTAKGRVNAGGHNIIRPFQTIRTSATTSNSKWLSLATTTAAGLGILLYTYHNTSDPIYAAAASSSSSSSASPKPGQRLPSEGIVGTNYERTFIAIKPDGVQRGLIHKIISRFEEKGFQLVAIKLIVPTEELAKGHYEDLNKKPFFPGLVRFFSSGPIIAMVWQGKGVILTGRRLLGETDPAKSLPGSIRGDYSIDIGRNIIHGSDGPEGAAHEVNFWFTPEEIYDWIPTQNQHIYEKP